MIRILIALPGQSPGSELRFVPMSARTFPLRPIVLPQDFLELIFACAYLYRLAVGFSGVRRLLRDYCRAMNDHARQDNKERNDVTWTAHLPLKKASRDGSYHYAAKQPANLADPRTEPSTHQLH